MRGNLVSSVCHRISHVERVGPIGRPRRKGQFTSSRKSAGEHPQKTGALLRRDYFSSPIPTTGKERELFTPSNSASHPRSKTTVLAAWRASLVVYSEAHEDIVFQRLPTSETLIILVHLTPHATRSILLNHQVQGARLITRTFTETNISRLKRQEHGSRWTYFRHPLPPCYEL